LILFDSGSFDWSHVVETFFGGLGACATAFTVLWLIYARNKDKSDKLANEERQALLDAVNKLEQKQEDRHEENQRRMGDISSLLRFVPPHRHREINGNLTADGIDYGPKNNR